MSASLRRPLPDASGRTPDLRPRRRSLLAGSALVGSSVVIGGGTALADGEEGAPVSGAEDQPSSAAGAGTQAAQPRTTTIALREAEHIERDGRLARHIVGHPAALVGVTWEEGGVEPTVSVRGLQVDGAWSPWHDLEVAVDLDTGVRSNGTEPVFFADVTEVEVIGEIDGEDVTEALNAHLIDFPDDPKQAPLELDEGAVSAEDAAQERSEQPPAEGEAATPSQEPQERLTEETAPAEETGEGEDPADAPAPSDGGGATVGGGGVGTARPALGPIVPMSLVPRDLCIPGAPRIVTRAQWGADERAARSSSTSSALKAVVLHHTAGTNNYSPSQAAQQIRGIFDYHVRTLGWADIGYNVLIDRYGTIYEGRRGGLTRNVNGAHALGFNTGSFGISVMGDYSSLRASSEAREAIMRVASWKLLSTFRAKVDETSSWTVGVDGIRWPRGTKVNMPRLFGHRDVNLTACPGNGLYNEMDSLRWGIQSRIDSGWRYHLGAFQRHGGESVLGTVLMSAQKEGDYTITRLSKGIVVSGPGLSARAATTTDSIRRSWHPSWGRPEADYVSTDGRYTQRFDNGVAVRENYRNRFVSAYFVDVPTSHRYFVEIHDLREQGIIPGWSGRRFLGKEATTRNQAVTFLYRLMGSPSFTPPSRSRFTDITPRHAQYKAVTWAHAQGILEPYADGTFRPSAAVRRDELSRLLYRAAGSSRWSPDRAYAFSDVSRSSEYATEIAWMADNEISTGWGRWFKPGDAVNHERLAALLTRFQRVIG
ncbi:S-layer homology domain-containing protein [Brachybacterium sp. p3-SID1565]|uniref:S-layer homology domain-containing protein n=1 Tax=Brachybacterium epidermidis TaxID=2781983 RepID=A0ABR9W097_9MICO|nr:MULTISPECIES: S-layer homology domain-containing protein [Brachybacterium]MBE9402748.1 S-layer homology domain-containing protein [Brachybacterium epidermidis]MCT1384598.1 S-layer homology domain-containing protein [Brachybacterium sp. p3-SID1565]